MKRSTFAGILVFLAAAVGALTAAWLYIRRREKELDEYEQLLFSEDFDEFDDEADDDSFADTLEDFADCVEDTVENFADTFAETVAAETDNTPVEEA